MTPDERKAWLAERRTGIGGSDSAAACGMSKWKTPLELFLDKRGEFETPENEAMRWGSLLEPVVRQEYADRTGRSVEVPRGIVRHPKTGFMILTADGIADGRRLYEGKTARASEGWGEEGSGDIPVEYVFQVQHGMYVTGLPIADVAVLIGGSDFRIYTLDADTEFQSMLVDAEAAFWRCVETASPPEVQNAEDVKRRWRVSTGTKIAATEAIAKAVETLAEIKAAIKMCEKHEEEIAAEVQRFMADAAELTHAGKPIATWKNINASPHFDLKRFRDERPDIHKQYLNEPKPQRKFLLKKGE